jgi:hypothetical protein
LAWRECSFITNLATSIKPHNYDGEGQEWDLGTIIWPLTERFELNLTIISCVGGQIHWCGYCTVTSI